MKDKMIQLDYSKLNALYESFVHQTEIPAEQTYLSSPSISNVSSESSSEKLDLPPKKMPNESKLLKLFVNLDKEIKELGKLIYINLKKDKDNTFQYENRTGIRRLFTQEVECIRSILIYKNMVKGYFAHKSKAAVLSKHDPFPKLNGKANCWIMVVGCAHIRLEVCEPIEGTYVKTFRMTTSVVTNSVFRDFLKKQKLSGPNFIDWYKQLRIVLSVIDKLDYLEQPITLALVPVSPKAFAAHAAWVKGLNRLLESCS
ncbi:zinc finger, CCHC-type containing protein [Tanacetum coccineum]